MLLETKQLTKRFRNPGKGPGGVLAVSQANITLNPGETVGLFGDSGSGKSTLGLMLAGLLRPTSGEVLYRGSRCGCPTGAPAAGTFRCSFSTRRCLLIPCCPSSAAWRSPTGSISSRTAWRFSTGTSPALASGRSICSGSRRSSAAGSCSGRPLARVLVLSPEILVLDEPTSMLDVITQAQMVRLLREYQAAHDTAYIFITHNRTLCDSLCSRVYHVEQGIVEEEGVKL